MYFVALILFVALTIPPAAKVLAIAVAVYALLQGLKKAPWFNDLLVGWWSVVFNVAFSIIGVIVVTPVDQLYTITTLTQIMTAVGTSAGIHGTVTLMKQKAEEQAQTPPPPSDKKNG